MKDLNVKSGADYANVLIDAIVEANLDLPTGEKEDSEFLEYWAEEIRLFADKTWIEYIKGERDCYKFDPEELTEVYQKAREVYVSILLGRLSEKGYVQTGIDKRGEIVYSLTEEGKRVVDRKR